MLGRANPVAFDRGKMGSGTGAAAAVAGVAGVDAIAATVPVAMAPRIDLLLCFADVFGGGVLSTLSALGMG